MEKHTGSKFVAGMDVAAVAKAIRADFKAAIKQRKLPADFKASVKISRFSGGSALDVVILEGITGCFNPEYWKHLDKFGKARPNRYTQDGATLLATVEEICKAYQRYESDAMTDYHHTNFFLDVRYDRDAEQSACAAVRANG